MTPKNGAPKDTLYEQVLDFARREIEDASSQMDALRQSLRLVEARVEAAKSVYEAVAARLNLEDELEEEAQLDGLSDVPVASPKPPVTPPQETVAPPPVAPPMLPPVEPSAPAPPVEQNLEHSPPVAPAAEAGNNGSADGFRMDLIRKHLEERDKAAQNAAQAPLQTPEAPASTPEAAPEASTPEPASTKGSEEGSSGGFPGLSEADRALIGEYLRLKRDG